MGEELRLGEFLRTLERASEEDLRAMCRLMARQVLVVYPAAIRYLAREAARNLAGVQPWSEEASAMVLQTFADVLEESA